MPVWIGTPRRVDRRGIALWMMRPLPPVVPGMVYIPAGTFLAGNQEARELGAFFIDETEVSNADFCKAMACSQPGREVFEGWNHQRGSRMQKSASVCRFTQGKRRPRNAGRPVPWGDQKDTSKANVSDNPAAS
jgi:formylglycine-generating enzyme required for sulfatase activity